ncbi:hypothetical protein [Paenibacillus beijingensis]|uniref:Uncharacterized protein n=1 Tax=Paenibacillus beijingensis TaxID=1126833 RepID=A0A0D5NGH6_9BACL|nr:hypothetical protein [Paenibacillus beijingensis]AJY74215.1 hypothetical protein VN24_06040 [Paenibacillus beijingensis]
MTFESANWTILATYDIDRDLLLDAVFFDHADESNVKVIDTNVGVMFEVHKQSLGQSNTVQRRMFAKIKAKQKNPYVKEESMTEKVTSMLTIEKVSAGGF